MNKITFQDINIPADIPSDKRDTYIENYLELTHHSGNLMLFAGDQKVEHLNDDFFGDGIAEDNNSPEHLFRVADKATVGCLATQFGLIALYGQDYPDVNYLVKMNSKSHLVKTDQKDPLSAQLFPFEHVKDLIKESNLKIRAVGYTIYTGSEYEAQMLTEASSIIHEAHREGLVTVCWMYPRGKAVEDEKDPHLIAGAAGVAAALGTDFAKVNYPKKEGESRAESMKEAVAAAGRTKLICSGGSSMPPEEFLQQLYDQIHIAGAQGNATGRNIHQKSLNEAVRMANAISAITIAGQSVEEAVAIWRGEKELVL